MNNNSGLQLNLQSNNNSGLCRRLGENNNSGLGAGLWKKPNLIFCYDASRANDNWVGTNPTQTWVDTVKKVPLIMTENTWSFDGTESGWVSNNNIHAFRVPISNGGIRTQSINDSSIFLTKEFTFYGWVKSPTNAGYYRTLFNKRILETTQYHFGQNITNLRMLWHNSTTGTLISTFTPTSGVWHSYVYTVKNNILNIYVDGISIYTISVAGWLTKVDTVDYCVGGTYKTYLTYTEEFTGDIATIAMLNKALEPSQAMSLHNRLYKRFMG